jgi:hypothetical protein
VWYWGVILAEVGGKLMINACDGINNPALGEFADCVEYTFDLGGSGEIMTPT